MSYWRQQRHLVRFAATSSCSFVLLCLPCGSRLYTWMKACFSPLESNSSLIFRGLFKGCYIVGSNCAVEQSWWVLSHYDPGLVGITGACATVETEWALFIGLVSGFINFSLSNVFLARKSYIDVWGNCVVDTDNNLDSVHYKNRVLSCIFLFKKGKNIRLSLVNTPLG